MRHRRLGFNSFERKLSHNLNLMFLDYSLIIMKRSMMHEFRLTCDLVATVFFLGKNRVFSDEVHGNNILFTFYIVLIYLVVGPIFDTLSVSYYFHVCLFAFLAILFGINFMKSV